MDSKKPGANTRKTERDSKTNKTAQNVNIVDVEDRSPTENVLVDPEDDNFSQYVTNIEKHINESNKKTPEQSENEPHKVDLKDTPKSADKHTKEDTRKHLIPKKSITYVTPRKGRLKSKRSKSLDKTLSSKLELKSVLSKLNILKPMRSVGFKLSSISKFPTANPAVKAIKTQRERQMFLKPVPFGEASTSKTGSNETTTVMQASHSGVDGKTQYKPYICKPLQFESIDESSSTEDSTSTESTDEAEEKSSILNTDVVAHNITMTEDNRQKEIQSSRKKFPAFIKRLLYFGKFSSKSSKTLTPGSARWNKPATHTMKKKSSKMTKVPAIDSHLEKNPDVSVTDKDNLVALSKASDENKIVMEPNITIRDNDQYKHETDVDPCMLIQGKLNFDENKVEISSNAARRDKLKEENDDKNVIRDDSNKTENEIDVSLYAPVESELVKDENNSYSCQSSKQFTKGSANIDNISLVTCLYGEIVSDIDRDRYEIVSREDDDDQLISRAEKLKDLPQSIVQLSTISYKRRVTSGSNVFTSAYYPDSESSTDNDDDSTRTTQDGSKQSKITSMEEPTSSSNLIKHESLNTLLVTSSSHTLTPNTLDELLTESERIAASKSGIKRKEIKDKQRKIENDETVTDSEESAETLVEMLEHLNSKFAFIDKEYDAYNRKRKWIQTMKRKMKEMEQAAIEADSKPVELEPEMAAGEFLKEDKKELAVEESSKEVQKKHSKEEVTSVKQEILEELKEQEKKPASEIDITVDHTKQESQHQNFPAEPVILSQDKSQKIKAIITTGKIKKKVVFKLSRSNARTVRRVVQLRKSKSIEVKAHDFGDGRQVKEKDSTFASKDPTVLTQQGNLREHSKKGLSKRSFITQHHMRTKNPKLKVLQKELLKRDALQIGQEEDILSLDGDDVSQASSSLWGEEEEVIPENLTRGILTDDKEPFLTGYFRDRERRIDMMMVVDNDYLTDVTERIRTVFLRNCILAGLDLELEAPVAKINQGRIFIKVHAPNDLITFLAQHLGMQKYFNDNLLEFMINNVAMETDYIRTIRSHYPGPAPFSTLDRISIVYRYMQSIPFGKAINFRGADRLLEAGILRDLYPLHDGPYYLLERDYQLLSELNGRQALFYTWVGRHHIFSWQPVHLIREYMGERVAFLFAFMEFVNNLLVFISLSEFVYFQIHSFHGDSLLPDEICPGNNASRTIVDKMFYYMNVTIRMTYTLTYSFSSSMWYQMDLMTECRTNKLWPCPYNSSTIKSGGWNMHWWWFYTATLSRTVIGLRWARTNEHTIMNTEDALMCPRCPNFRACPFTPLGEFCTHVKLINHLDNPYSLPHAACTVIWGLCVAYIWKKKENYLSWLWEVRVDDITYLQRPNFTTKDRPHWIKKLLKFLLYVAVLIIYIRFYVPMLLRLQDKILMRMHHTKASAVVVEWSVLAFVAAFDAYISLWWRELFAKISFFVNSTRSEYEAEKSRELRLAIALFGGTTLASFGLSFYIAFFKGAFFTYPADPHSWALPARMGARFCGPAGCMEELHIVLTATLVSRACFQEFGKTFHQLVSDLGVSRWTTRHVPCWEREYRLLPLLDNHVMRQYNAIMLKIGCVCFFSWVHPFWSFCMFFMNLFHIRAVANYFLLMSRRPLPTKRYGLGAWNYVLQSLPFLTGFLTITAIARNSNMMRRHVFREWLSWKYYKGGYFFFDFALRVYNVSQYTMNASLDKHGHYERGSAAAEWAQYNELGPTHRELYPRWRPVSYCLYPSLYGEVVEQRNFPDVLLGDRAFVPIANKFIPLVERDWIFWRKALLVIAFEQFIIVAAMFIRLLVRRWGERDHIREAARFDAAILNARLRRGDDRIEDTYVDPEETKKERREEKIRLKKEQLRILKMDQREAEKHLQKQICKAQQKEAKEKKKIEQAKDKANRMMLKQEHKQEKQQKALVRKEQLQAKKQADVASKHQDRERERMEKLQKRDERMERQADKKDKKEKEKTLRAKPVGKKQCIKRKK